jgi:hypothetical protein
VNLQSPNAGRGAAGADAAPIPWRSGTDPYRQSELLWLMRISERLDTIILLLTIIMLATVVTALLILIPR